MRIILVAVAVLALAQTALAHPALAHPSIDIAASNWKFVPATVEAHVGELTTLRLTSTEGVHGIESSDLGIKKTVLVPNKLAEVSFTPAKAGTYKVKCAIVCGPGHDDMILTIKVVP